MKRTQRPSEQTLAAFGELRLIERIRKKVLSRGETGEKLVVEGIGDDTAVLKWEKDWWLLLTCDTLVEGVHFVKGTAAYRVGWKAMGCNLSDIAAMGGIPLYAVVSLACPARTSVGEIDEMYAGMMDLARRFGVSIVGGDTVESPGGLCVTVALIGKVEKNRHVARSGAKPGDAICVTGRLGGSLLGKHLAFIPRVEEGRALATKCSPSAMIDISDGLASDLLKLLEASGVSAEISEDAIPVSEDAVRFAKQTGRSPVEHALQDGEDFELLFTLPEEKVGRCLRLFRRSFSTPVTVIGKVKKGRKKPILKRAEGSSVVLEGRGYEHFQSLPAAARKVRRSV